MDVLKNKTMKTLLERLTQKAKQVLEEQKEEAPTWIAAIENDLRDKFTTRKLIFETLSDLCWLVDQQPFEIELADSYFEPLD